MQDANYDLIFKNDINFDLDLDIRGMLVGRDVTFCIL